MAIVLLRVLRLVLRVLTAPLRWVRALQRRPLRITPFRGYGTSKRAVVRGRVVDTPPTAPGGHGRLHRLRVLFRRLSTPPVPAATLEGVLGGVTARARSGSDGLFTLRFEGLALEEGGWAPVELHADSGPGRRAEARAHVLVPPSDARFGVISDIDDTVVFTGVASRLGMMWRLFATEAESRVAFDGVGAFYRALHRGAEGEPAEAGNPIFYVSRGPWSIYPVLEAFFRQHTIPIGPVLLLRDWGVHLAHPWPKRARHHKRELVDELLTLYPKLPFLLIGDSGQHDPEIYADVARRFGDRIACVYIREVTHDPDRNAALERLAREVARCGSELVVADDTRAMSRHAAERGFISARDVARVQAQTRRDRDAPPAPFGGLGRAPEES